MLVVIRLTVEHECELLLLPFFLFFYFSFLALYLVQTHSQRRDFTTITIHRMSQMHASLR